MIIATLFDNHESVPADVWRWRNFTAREIACKHCGQVMLNFHALDCLQALRERLVKPLRITSAYRCAEHNESVGGASRSFHREGRAFDLITAGFDVDLLAGGAKLSGFTGIGKYPNRGFLHVDTGDAREWTG